MFAQAIKVGHLLEADKQRLLDENIHLKQELRERYDFSHIIGNSGPLRQVYEQVTQVARTNTTVLLRGESGTGKELIAHAIHYNSLRSAKPFIKVSCAALPETLIESELFGYEKGAFTGAQVRKKGRFELAEGGTLFLDEVGDLNVSTQIKLLRVLQEREFERLGGTETSGCRHQQGHGARHRRRVVSRRPVLSTQRVRHLHATIARSQIRRAAAGRSFSRKVCARTSQEHQAHLDSGD